MKPILIIEDDPDIAEGVRYNLERDGLEARVALSMFLSRFPRYALDGEPERDLRARFRGFRRLPARLH